MSRLSPARLGLLALTLVAPAAAAPAAGAATPLNGTFGLAPGKYQATKKAGRRTVEVSGSYFRMIYPKGSLAKGPFFANSDSRAKDNTYTLFRPGIDGGLRTGVFQEQPKPAFDNRGFALANRIVRPLPFAGIEFSLSTANPDAQSGAKVGVPTISANGRRLTGDLRAFTASWNSIYFNQGAPKPAGNLPGLTRAPRGTYDPKTKRYTIDWVSQIVGGPFNDFSGYWHFEGRFEPGS